MTVPFNLEHDTCNKWLGIYPFDDSTIDNIMNYCCEKVWKYICKHSTTNWANMLPLSEYRIEMLKQASEEEVQSYLANGGDFKDEKGSNSVDDSLCSEAKSTLRRAGFLTLGVY